MSTESIPLKPCPECGRAMIRNGVMLMSNVLLDEAAVPVWRWDCPDCEVILADHDIDLELGLELWDLQNALKRDNQLGN